MARLILTILFALWVATVLSSPVSSQKRRSFKVHRVEVKNYVPDGPAALKRAYKKFGINEFASPTAGLKKRNTISINLGGDIKFLPTGEMASRIKSAAENSTTEVGSEDGETPAIGTQNDAQFLSPVTVGGQQMVVNFDSGSSDTWVFNTNLPSQLRRSHTIYDPSKSTNFKDLQGSVFNISYGDGSSASGPVGLDTFDIGGSTVNQQAIGLPNVVSGSFVTDSTSNGLVGLAFSKLNTVRPQPQKTFFDNVVADLTQPVFTAQLKGGTAGAYEFGIIDTSAFTGELAVVPIDSSRGFWEFESTKAVTNNQQANIPNGKAIADTGTSLMLVPDEMLALYWDQVAGAESNDQVGGVIFPCNANLPDLSVAVGGQYMATVAGADMNFAQVGTDTSTGVSFCFGGLQSNQGLSFAIYGDVWFKSQFVVFEATGPSLGIAPHA